MRTGFIFLSVLLWMFAFSCYWFRPDSCAAFTLWPAWMWLICGLVLLMLGAVKTTLRYALAVLVLWSIFTVIHVEEAKSLLHRGGLPDPDWQNMRKQEIAFRVVTLNCSGGSETAAGEVEKYRPDIVLLQESPGKREVEKLAHKLFGGDAGVAWGVDGSIIVRGKLEAVDLPSNLRVLMSEARVKLKSGMTAQVISLRLTPPVFRTDMWSHTCRREMTDNRKLRREQVLMVVDRVRLSSLNTPVVVGGDFNAPAGDGAFRPFLHYLHDTFKEGGRGWGNTVLNDVPVLRFDQIWASRHLKAHSVTARETRYSDHRLVVCDLIVR